MEYRKLISFGKSSFVVSLPKSWVIQQKLKKGDLIYLQPSKNDLIVQAHPQKRNGEQLQIVISVDGKNLKRIEREILAAYVNNYKTITLSGSEIKNQAKIIQEFIQKLVALEIVEQDSKKIIAKDFLNLNDISITQIIKKMDVISRSMFSDCKNMFNEDNYDSIFHRDQDINKFRYLVYRIVWHGMKNPTDIFKRYNLNNIDLFNYWWFSFSIEQIGDCIKRIARYMKTTKLSKKSQDDFLDLLNEIEKNYLMVLKGFYSCDFDIAHQISDDRGKLIQQADNFFTENRDALYIGFMVYNTKSLISNINAIAKVIYQRMPI
tara:strand:- start:1335 stop:2294 length:960 start_codon:yes stop_codon:yes gene_type:complete